MSTTQQSSPGDRGNDSVAAQKTQSDTSLSRAPGADDSGGQFSVAEEVNLDQQGEQARTVGRMPQDAGLPASPSEAMAKSMKQEKAEEAKNRGT